MFKVVDIFAGPGGLSEGFASVANSRGKPAFQVVLSIEKDPHACETLRLRTFFRQFSETIPVDYYRFLRSEVHLDALYAAHPAAAKAATELCWRATLGPNGEPSRHVRRRIANAVGEATGWVLIGGPPCQAYSIAGRSRNQGNPEYDPNKDVRQRLYIEYLNILAEYRPAVFIMENVTGLLSATLENEHIFHRILDDLQDPSAAVAREGCNGRRVRKGRYRIYSLTQHRLFNTDDLRAYVIHAEKYGVPQARHRVFLFGISDDLTNITPKILVPQAVVHSSSVLSHLPRLRSGLSRRIDSAEEWRRCLQSQLDSRWANAGAHKADSAALSSIIRSKLAAITLPEADRGGEFVPCDARIKYAPDWFCDHRIGGICNHRSRLHMESDLFRYIYAACYAQLHGRSPALKHFPKDLLPDHWSVDNAIEEGGNFSDRFRVQVASKPCTTIVSHISKDGHYYIHPDPLQCRSLTVREAARVQTFPDNYFFYGPRTAQYVQVGNAVPPYLAKQIGEIVFDVLQQAGAND